MNFGNTQGLYLLGFIIPLIIMYLIKAKPKELTIPSLLFFIGEKKVKKYNAILKKLLLRLLFFIQLLFILLIAFSASNPIIRLPLDAFSLNTVVIVDASASMSTKDTTISRMDAGKQELLKHIKGRASIILAEQNPVVLASNVSSSRAKALITNLEAKDIPTRIDSSILLADDMLGKERGSIIIYSDFVLNRDDDILSAKKVAEANNKRVFFVQTGKKQENLGFAALNLRRGKGEAYIKNYGQRSEVVDVKLQSESRAESKRIEIAPYSTERIGFDIEKGETTLEIARKDRLTADDKIFVMNPYTAETKILFITNKKGKSPLLDALESNNQLKVEITRPPVIPDLNYDLVVISDIDKSLLLPNTFRDIKKYKETGGKVIIASHLKLKQV